MRHLASVVLVLVAALAMPALAADRAKAEKALKDALAANNADGVQTACDELIECGGKEALNAILGVAGHVEGAVYWQVTNAAAGFKDAAALDELGKYIVSHQGDSKGALSRDLLFGLQNNHSSSVTGPLAYVLEKGSYDLKLMAVDQLAVMRSADALDALVSAMKRDEKTDAELVRRIDTGLRAITGESFNTAADWDKWWKDQKPKGVPAPKAPANAPAGGAPSGTMEKPRDKEWKGTIDRLPAGRIVVVKGVYDNTETILKANSIPFTSVAKNDFNEKPGEYLKDCWALLINCDDYHSKKSRISKEALDAVKTWVENGGGFLFTEDWGLVDITSVLWPDKITTLKQGSDLGDPPMVRENTVKITPAKGNTSHPLMRGVWQKPRPVVPPTKQEEDAKTVERTESPAQPLNHKWKIDDLSACLKIVDTANVIVLLESEELAKEPNGTPYVAVTFRTGNYKPDPGPKKTATGPGANAANGANTPKTQEWNALAKGGRVLHVMSHYGHQSGKDDGQALQNLLVNFLLEATKHHPG